MAFDEQRDPASPFEPAGPPERPPVSAPPAAETQPVREDLRVAWGGRDVLVFFAVVAAGLLFTTVLFGAALLVWNFVGGPSYQELMENPTAKTALAVGQQTMLNALLVAFIVVVVTLRARAAGAEPAGFWRSIGWRPVRFAGGSAAASFLLITLAGMILAVVLQLLSALKPPEGPVPIEEFFRTRESVVILIVAAVGMAPLVEELIFRGFLYPVIARRLGVAAGVMLTGALFGLMHVPQLRGAWWQIALLFGVGIVFTWVRAATGSVAAAFFLHLGYNAMQMLSVVFSSDGLRSFPPAGP
jgi:membrane protease YdiL (CAAX protease family)